MLSELSKKSRKLTDYIEDYEYTEVLASEQTLETNMMAQQKLGIYCEAVASLPEKCRRVVLLKKVYGLSHKEIAEKMGIKISTVEKHLTKGVRQCHVVMSERYGAALSEKKALEKESAAPSQHNHAEEEGRS